MLANSRHEAFAHAIARGATADAAYVEAGYVRNDGNAARLNGHERVVRRVAELKNLVQKMRNRSSHKIVLTEQWVIEQLIGVVLDARAQDRPDSAGANKALNLLGLHLGMFIERQEVGAPGEFHGLTIADKKERVLAIARELGLVHLHSEETRRYFGGAAALKLLTDSDHERSAAPKPPVQ